MKTKTKIQKQSNKKPNKIIFILCFIALVIICAFIVIKRKGYKYKKRFNYKKSIKNNKKFSIYEDKYNINKKKNKIRTKNNYYKYYKFIPILLIFSIFLGLIIPKENKKINNITTVREVLAFDNVSLDEYESNYIYSNTESIFQLIETNVSDNKIEIVENTISNNQIEEDTNQIEDNRENTKDIDISDYINKEKEININIEENKEVEEETDYRDSKYTSNTGYEIYNHVYEEDIILSFEEVEDYVYIIADKYEYLSPSFIYGIMKKESTFQSDAYSSAKCVGFMQLNPKWQVDRMERLGCTNLFDPYENILVGCDYYNTLIKEHGEDQAMRIYLYGADYVSKHPNCGSDYISKVRKYQKEWEEIYSDNYYNR